MVPAVSDGGDMLNTSGGEDGPRRGNQVRKSKGKWTTEEV